MALRQDNLDRQASGVAKPAVSDAQVEKAFRTIIEWIGEDPNRDGLIETPNRHRCALIANISPATRRTRTKS